MAYNESFGYKTERLAAAGAINGGKPIRKLVAVGVKGGAAAGSVEWHEAASAADPATRRGGVSVGIGLWAWSPVLGQQLSQVYFNLSAADMEVVVVYAPHTSG